MASRCAVIRPGARAEIWQSWRAACAENVDHLRAKELFNRHKLPAFHDPFAGGGALPLEAQQLGLESYASDLNPVAVLINGCADPSERTTWAEYAPSWSRALSSLGNSRTFNIPGRMSSLCASGVMAGAWFDRGPELMPRRP